MNNKPTNNAVVLTKEIFKQAESSNGGFSTTQLALFDITFPPVKGWKKQLMGTTTTQEIVDIFIKLKDKHLTVIHEQKGQTQLI